MQQLPEHRDKKAHRRMHQIANTGLLVAFGAYLALAYYTLVILR